MKIILIFIDGLGIGVNDLSINPCAHPEIKIFNHFLNDDFPTTIPFNGQIKPIDANLGIQGIPQSATGQTTLFTGINASKYIGAHLSGFPNRKLRLLLKEKSIFKQLNDLKKTAAFINVFRPVFFEKGPEALIKYLSVTSIANWQANLKFFSFDDLRANQAIYHDFTNEDLIRKNFLVPQFSPELAGNILSNTVPKYDFCLYEYFKTDHAGHAQKLPDAVKLFSQLEKFLLSFLSNIDFTKSLVLLTSDHGNIEDLSLKTHTKNPVPLLAWGIRKEELLNKINSIIDITPAIINLMKIY